MKNKCKNCNAKIEKGKTYCNKCQDLMTQNAPMEYMKAMMRGDISTANRIKAENPNFEVTSMGMEGSDGPVRVCSNCGFRNPSADFLFLKEYSCSKCGNKI